MQVWWQSQREKRAGRGCAWRLRLSVSVCAITAIFASSLPVSAESLRDALSSAYLHNPRLDAERARLRATDEDVARADSGFRPVIRGTAETSRETLSTTPETAANGEAQPWGYTLTMRQNVFDGFRTTNEISETTALVKAGRETLRQVEGEVLLQGVTAYMDVVRDEAIVRIRDSNIAVLTRELEAAETRRAVKEVTLTDVAQAQARRARAVSEADVARANLKISRARYERVIGHPPQSVNMPPMKIRGLPDSIEVAWELADQENPQLGTAMFREEAARYAVDKVRGGLLPEVNLEASLEHQADTGNGFIEQDEARVTGRVSVPLYDGGEIRARVRQAKHTHVSRIQDIEDARAEAQANVTAAWSRLVAARGQLKSDTIQVDANRVALDGVREEEKVGQRTLLDVLNAEQEFLDAQINLVSTRRDLVVAGYQVLATVGILNAETLQLGTEIYAPDVHFDEARQNWFGVDVTHSDGRREIIRADDPADGEANLLK
jgi:outer membrane protein